MKKICKTCKAVFTAKKKKRKFCSRKCGGKSNKTHGQAGIGKRTPEYIAWGSMHQRCGDKNHISYPRYGGRGIKVHPEWNSFEKFLEDMGPRPGPEYSIDRIDNNGNYETDNCKWSTRKEQMRNRGNNRMLLFNDEVKCLAEWAEITGIHRRTIKARIDRYGWSVEDALTKPVKHKQPKEIAGE